MGQIEGWAMDEFSDVELGDKRLNQRLVKLCDSLSESPESPINQACADWAETKAAYRFFQNENVDAGQIMEAHCRKTAERVQGHGTILAIQDTSYIMYTNHPKTSGLAKLTMKKGKRVDKIYSKGLLMHNCLAITTEGLPLGFLDQKILSRPPESKHGKKDRNTIPIEEKESYRWLQSLQKSMESIGETQVVTVCDREADMYEFLKLSQDIDAPVLVRATCDRPVNKRSMYTEDPVVKLWDYMEQQPWVGTFQVEIPARRSSKHTMPRVARVATLQLKYGTFQLNPPKRLSSSNPDIKMSAVHVVEKDAPEGVEPLEWMLLSSIEVRTFDEAYEKVKWYTLRWRVETYHKVLKSGFNIEKCRLETAERLIRYLTVMSIVAWRLFMITLIARTDPELPCSSFLADDEWKVLFLKVNKKTKIPKKVPTIGQVVVWIARLGGFLNRKSDGYPGITALWRGWKRLADLQSGWNLAARYETCG